MRDKFTPEDIVDALANHRVTMLQGPPTLFARLLAHLDKTDQRKPTAPHLRYVYTGAGPLDLALKQRVEACFDMPLHHGYGSSEVTACCVTPMNVRRDDTAAGYMLEGFEMRIVDGNGEDVPNGEAGEIWVRGPGVTPGYFRDQEATRQAFRPGGWYASGDLGRIGPDGALFVVGRLKEMIIRSGFNVYPAEVEEVLNHFPAVQRSAVVGRPEADGNEQVIAFIELRHGAQFDEAALESYLRDQLAAYKRPVELHVMQSFPMTDSGKVLKRELARHQASPDLRCARTDPEQPRSSSEPE
jgi:acyl-CoA synthetase (AMP-forming)/AMP-acid ligase II